MAMKRKLSVDDETYALVAAFQASEAVKHGPGYTLADAACELIREGSRAKAFGFVDGPLSAGVRRTLRAVAEEERSVRAEETASAMVRFEGCALDAKAAAFAVLLANGATDMDVAEYYERGLALAVGSF